MNAAASEHLNQGKFTGSWVDLLGFGRTRLTTVLAAHGETAIYHAEHPGVLVKTFDLDCGKADEISYAPFVSFSLERDNFQDISAIGELARHLPAFYGAAVDYERKLAYLAMEHLYGQNLLDWCGAGAALEHPAGWVQDFRAAIHETLEIVTHFHRHQIVLIDFKPDNVIRMYDGTIKFVDLGAFFTPRHSQATENYVYSTTPDYSELVIDTSNVQTGRALNDASDIFAAGVALFEMPTGRSRLAIARSTCEELLGVPGLYRFRDTQIRDVWKAYPHLKDVLPLLEQQLREGQLLFSEVWHLLKAHLAQQVGGWEELPEIERHSLVLETGRALIAEQLPPALEWLADPIARATTFRSIRLRSIGELMDLIASPISVEDHALLVEGHPLSRYLQDLGCSLDFLAGLNTWQVRRMDSSERLGILAPCVCAKLPEVAPFTFLRREGRDDDGHTFYRIVADSDADRVGDVPLTLDSLGGDHRAWLVG